MPETDLYRRAKDYARQSGSLYCGAVKDRENLLGFLEMNDWFGYRQGVSSEGSAFSGRTLVTIKEDAGSKLFKHLELWFAAYKKPHSEKLEILAAYGRKKLPETTENFMRFIEEVNRRDDISSWRLLDFMLYHLKSELTELGTGALEEFAKKLDTEATRDASILFSRFNQWIQEKQGISGWSYRYEYRKKRENTEAYTLKDFSVMAYCIFNGEHWEKEDMLQKACDSAVSANLWAFIAMHFVCGLRSTDIIRLPRPELPECGEKVRKSILDGTFAAPESISQDIQVRIRCSARHPHKTLGHDHVPELKVFIPQTLEKPLGIILAIAASHRDDVKPGENFIRADRSVSHMRGFFGNEFMKATGGKGFASSRANKSYLQGIEATADEGNGSPKGYMIAALARSHKGGIGTLPNTTDIYLRDAAFSGYSPEFIAREMFERGVFGFIPHLLLDVYAGKTYTSLTVSEQTEVIRSVGIRPSGIEALVRLNEAALQKANSVVSEVVSGSEDCGKILQRIASGEAVGKQKESLCVMSACGYGCAFVERAACIGCRYEIHTKAFLHQLASEYSRMKELTAGEDGWRYARIVRETILPVVGEYLETVKKYSDPVEMRTVAGILEGGLNGYDDGSE